MTPLARPQPEQEKPEMNPTEAEYFRSIGRLEGQVSALVSTTNDMKAKIDNIDTKLETKFDKYDKRINVLERLASRVKGGFTVILGIGAFIGFAIDHAVKWITQR